MNMRCPGRQSCLGIVIGTLAWMSMPLIASAQGTPSDSLAIRSRAQSTGASATQPIALPSLGFDITRMLLALAIVVALIYLSRWILKRFYGGSVSPAGNRVVQVLSRTALAPRQQVLLLQVGRRVIVVGESNGTMATLAQIEDPDEIAQLVGRLHDEQSTRTGAFGGLFGRAQARMADDAGRDVPGAGEPAAGDAGSPKSELSGLLEKVRAIRGQMDRE